jgi:hypothetical protein
MGLCHDYDSDEPVGLCHEYDSDRNSESDTDTSSTESDSDSLLSDVPDIRSVTSLIFFCCVCCHNLKWFFLLASPKKGIKKIISIRNKAGST